MTPAERIPSEPTRLDRRPKRFRRLAIAAAALAAAVIATVAWRATRPAPAPKYETVRVERGRIVAQVTATGTLSALVTVQVGSQVSGRIAKLLVDFNRRTPTAPPPRSTRRWARSRRPRPRSSRRR